MNKIYINRKPAMPLQYHGQLIPDYYITTCGIVYSTRRGGVKKISHGWGGLPGKIYARAKVRDKQGKVIQAFVHQYVLHSWRPLDQYPELIGIEKKVWEKLPDHAKHLIRRGLFVNHKNHQKFDNRLKNLEYVTPQENSVKARKFYAA